MRIANRGRASVLVWLLAPALVLAEGDPLLRFFPTPADVPGLKAMGDVRHCGAGEELTLLYDGGYQRYVQA